MIMDEIVVIVYVSLIVLAYGMWKKRGKFQPEDIFLLVIGITLGVAFYTKYEGTVVEGMHDGTDHDDASAGSGGGPDANTDPSGASTTATTTNMASSDDTVSENIIEVVEDLASLPKRDAFLIYTSSFHRDSVEGSLWMDVSRPQTTGLSRAFMFSQPIHLARDLGILLQRNIMGPACHTVLPTDVGRDVTIVWYGTMNGFQPASPTDDDRDILFRLGCHLEGSTNSNFISVKYTQANDLGIEIRVQYLDLLPGSDKLIAGSNAVVINNSIDDDFIFADGKPHMYVLTREITDSGVHTIKVYLDGKPDPMITMNYDLEGTNPVLMYATNPMSLNPGKTLNMHLNVFGIVDTLYAPKEVDEIYEHIKVQVIRYTPPWQELNAEFTTLKDRIQNMENCPFSDTYGDKAAMCTTSCADVSRWNSVQDFTLKATDKCLEDVKSYCEMDEYKNNVELCGMFKPENATKMFATVHEDDAKLLTRCKANIDNDTNLMKNPAIDNIIVDKSFRTTGMESNRLLKNVMTNFNVPLDQRARYQNFAETDDGALEFVDPDRLLGAADVQSGTSATGTGTGTGTGLIRVGAENKDKYDELISRYYETKKETESSSFSTKLGDAVGTAFSWFL